MKIFRFTVSYENTNPENGYDQEVTIKIVFDEESEGPQNFDDPNIYSWDTDWFVSKDRVWSDIDDTNFSLFLPFEIDNSINQPLPGEIINTFIDESIEKNGYVNIFDLFIKLEPYKLDLVRYGELHEGFYAFNYDFVINDFQSNIVKLLDDIPINGTELKDYGMYHNLSWPSYFGDFGAYYNSNQVEESGEQQTINPDKNHPIFRFKNFEIFPI